MSTLDFSGKSILVTGGSSGIGYAIARAFATAGADITVLAEGDDVSAAAERISRIAGRPVKALQADIADPDAVAAAFRNIDAVDVLINNAGFGVPVSIDDLSEEALMRFRRVIDVNLVGTYLVTRQAVRVMPHGGRILITASTVGRGKHLAGLPAYSASKAGLQGLAQSLAAELGPRRITVNCVCPGPTRVPWMDDPCLIFEIEKATHPRLHSKGILTLQTAADIATVNMVLGDGLLTPESLVPTYLYLASDGAADITGQCIHVDRGDVMS